MHVKTGHLRNRPLVSTHRRVSISTKASFASEVIAFGYRPQVRLRRHEWAYGMPKVRREVSAHCSGVRKRRLPSASVTRFPLSLQSYVNQGLCLSNFEQTQFFSVRDY